MKIHKAHFLIALFLMVLGLGHKMCAQNRFEFKSNQMGTQIRLIFYTVDKDRADIIANIVFKRIKKLNIIMSNYISNSELNKLCILGKRNVRVSDDLYTILKLAVDYSKKTGGAFDITTGPYIELWKKTRINQKLPSKKELSALSKKVGYQNIGFTTGENIVYLKRKDMQLDLGGIGKGFTADEVIKVLESNGVMSALIDMGGDISVSNPPPNKEYWMLAFSYIDKDKNEKIQKIKLKNESIATSGDMFQNVEIDGVRFSHIIDPSSGMALTNNIQVTIIASSATLADAYASALSVMGIDKGIKFVEQEANIKAFIVQQSVKGIRQWNNKEFKDFFVN